MAAIGRHPLNTLVATGMVALLLAVPAATVDGATGPTGTGAVSVQVTPEVPVQIRVGSISRNTTQIRHVNLEAGTHQVCASHVPGYLPPPCETVEVRAGEHVNVELALQRAGTLDVRTEPAVAASIIVDGVERDRSSIRLPVAVGQHEVCFEQVTGHRAPACQTVTVTEDDTTNVVGRYRASSDEPDPAPDPEPDPIPGPVPSPGRGSEEPVTAAVSGTDPSFALACPVGGKLTPRFSDVPAKHAHGQAIACANEWGFIGGKSVSVFAPNDSVTRAQVASMLARMLDATNATLPTGARRTFSDVSGGAHADNIHRLAAAGIIDGGSDGRFRPNAPIRRDQMASLLIRALDRGYDIVPTASAPSFTDVRAGVHAANVTRLVGAGITQGVRPGVFAPGADVRRDQMATFMMRTAALLVDEGAARPAAAVTPR